MTQVAEKITLTPETFENVNRMLVSPDEENAIVALSALEGMDFRSCKMYMALLYKESRQKNNLWKEHCPKLLANIQGLGLDEQVTLRSIFNTLKEDATPGEMEVFCREFEKGLKGMLKGWNFGAMIDDLDIKITTKK